MDYGSTYSPRCSSTDPCQMQKALDSVSAPRGWQNMEFGYTVTKIIRAPSSNLPAPAPTPPQKRKFSDFLCQKHAQSGNR